MKKTLLCTLLFITVVTVSTQAQITKGSTLLGGNLSYGQFKADNGFSVVQKNSTFSVNPSAGIAFKDNLVAGLSVGYITGKEKQLFAPANELNVEKHGYMGGAFVRKYKQLAKSDFYLFGEAELSYSYMKQERHDLPASSTIFKENNIYLGFKPGLSYAVNNRLHLELGLNNLLYGNYSFSKEFNHQTGTTVKRSGTSISTNITNLSNNISVGVRFLLAK